MEELKLPPHVSHVFTFGKNNIQPFNGSFFLLFINSINQYDDNLLWNGFFINNSDYYTKYYSHFYFN
jgi:hypothetical protein